MRIVILGAGPTGLGAAWTLNQTGADWTLLEQNDQPGGLAASFSRDGFTWDIGGHILFSHYPYFDQVLAEVMPPDAWQIHQRRAYIRLQDAWVPYPFQYNIRHLPREEQRRCLQGVKEAGAACVQAFPANFEEWIYRTMGRGLADLFMLPYNRKVWAGSPAEMATQWVGDRVAVPDIERMMRHLDAATDDVGWGPNNAFRFPDEGGTGAIWRNLAAQLPRQRLLFNSPVVAVNPDRRVVITGDGRTLPYDALISTIPLDRLTSMAGLKPLSDSATGLVRTRTWVGGVGIRGPMPVVAQGKCWMYFPEPEYPFYRVTVFNNYSARNAPAGCYSLMAEISSRVGDPELDDATLMESSISGLRRCGLIAPDGEPVQTWSHFADYGYPVPTLGRDAILNRVLPVLDAMGIYSRGRFGAWKYEVGNMDHSFMQGVEVARRVLTGSDEETVWHPDRVNGAGKG